MKRGGGVYLLEALDSRLYKIGLSRTPRSRRRRINTIRPCRLLHVIYTPDRASRFALETLLHHRYADKRHRGEWFLLSPTDVASICSMKHWTPNHADNADDIWAPLHTAMEHLYELADAEREWFESHPSHL
jgi:hypothetical protein